MDMLVDSDGNEIFEEGEQPTMEEMVVEKEHWEVHNATENTIDPRKLHATKIKNCPRVYIPKGRPAKEEAQFCTRDTMIDKEIQKLLERIKTSDTRNLTASESRGIKKLSKRVKEGELVIYQTDKSGKFCVTDREGYKRQGEVHTRGDKIMSWDEVRAVQREVTGHLKAINKIFQTGKDYGKEGAERACHAKPRTLLGWVFSVDPDQTSRKWSNTCRRKDMEIEL